MDKPRTLPFWGALLLFLNVTSVPLAIAGPAGGQVVGGSGSISQSGLNTTINQTSQNMAIDWQSYNLNANERVQYLQPNSSSISLNRILSQNGSTIAGRIDANGQVILVNPNGIFFTPTSIINVGGIIASGLNIQPNDFMNGHYMFNEVLDTDGAVINSGIINASLGGNVALIGKQVENDGFIVANLGAATLAAGKQAVLTFDQDGLLGVRISKEILQEELGIDPAVINRGEINAEGGRVLLTASTSQDIFSQAVNTGDLDQSTSVVVHADGSFTLGGGADVINTGRIDTSTTANDQNLSQSMGRIVLIGENVTSSSELLADAANGNGGEIELLAQNTVLLTENSVTSARSEANGQGGMVKVLGNNVGLFDQSRVDVSGANGGGQALIGGDYLGGNANIRNATTTVVGRETVLTADALQQGEGGRVILWSDQNTYFWGNITVRGGALSGNGGFVETSGKENLLFDGSVDLSANNGNNGMLLLDPRDITVVSGNANQNTQNNDELTEMDLNVFFGDSASLNDPDFNITATRIESVLASGNVQLAARRDIDIDADINASPNNNKLTLLAGDDITVNNNINLGSGDLLMVAGSASCQTNCDTGGGGSGNIGGSNIYINGQLDTTGSIDLYAADHVILDKEIGDTLRPTSVTIRAGDSILVNAIDNDNSIEPGSSSNQGRITSSGTVSLTAADTALQTDEITINSTSGLVTTAITVSPTNTSAGAIVVEGNVTTGNGNFEATTTAGYFNNLFDSQTLDTGTGSVTIQTGSTDTLAVDGTSVTAGAFLGNITADVLSVTTKSGIIQSTVAPQNLVVTGEASFNAGSNPIDLLNSHNNLQGTISLVTSDNNAATLNNGATTTTLGTTTEGALHVGGALTVNAKQNLTLANNITVGGAAQLNFAQDGNNGHIFTTSTGLAFAANTTVAGGDGNDIFNITSSMAGKINGNGGDDTFNIQADGLTANLFGGIPGTDTDTVTANDSTNSNTWDINAAGDGTLANTDGIVSFSNIENLTGGTGIDDFIFTDTGAISEMIDGGGGIGINTLTGRNTDSSWTITNINTGRIIETASLLTSTPTHYVENFTNIQRVIGGEGDDVFTLETAGGVSNIIGGIGSDRLVIHATGSQIIELGDRNNTHLNVFQIENIIANAGVDNTLISDRDIFVNTWEINSDNGGSITDTVTNTSVDFSNIGNLMGSDTDDHFVVDATINNINVGNGTNNITVNSNAYVTGTMTGGNGNDTLIVNALEDRIVQLGGIASDGADYTVNNIEVINAGITTSNTLRAGTGTNIWDINTDNGGDINGITFSNFAKLEGNSGTDNFAVDAAIHSIDTGNGSNSITVSSNGSVSGAITGGTGVDIVDIVGSAVSISTGDNDDKIAFSGTVSGLIDGGAGKDHLTITAMGDRVIELGNRSNANQNVDQIETLTANMDTSNILIGNSNVTSNEWTITDARNGSVFDQAITTTFSNINHITGGEQTDIIKLESNHFTGLINGANGIDSVFVHVDNDQVVEIGDRTNTNLNIYQVENITAHEGAERNELIGDIGQIKETTNWVIDGANTGQLTDGVNTVRFTNFTDISGANGNAVDRFTVSGSTAASLSGLINGMGGSDRLIITADGDRVIELGNRRNENLNVFQVEILTANSLAANELISDSNAIKNSWIVNVNNGGTLSDNGANNITFSNFSTLSGGMTIDEFILNAGVTIHSLNGGSGNDIFTIAGSVTDSINGGNNNDIVMLNTGSDVGIVNLGMGNDRFIINGGNVKNGVYGDDGDDTFVSDGGNVKLFNGGGGDNDRVSYTEAVTITLGDAVSLGGVAVENIEGVEAINGTINARQDVTTTTWTISGNNEGQVYDDETGFGQVLSFSGFSTINGGEGVDVFTVNGNGSVSDSINGNGGDDRLNINLDANRLSSGQINFAGGDGNDVITITGVSGTYAETWRPDASGYDQLSFIDDNSITFVADYREVEAINDDIQTTSLTINSEGNNIELGDNRFSIIGDDAVAVNYQAGSKPNITVLAQNNNVNITSNVSIANNLTIAADTITQNTASTLIAGHLTLDNVNQAGSIENRLTTNVNELAIINHSGLMAIEEQNDITLTEISNTTGSIDITTVTGSVLSAADLITHGTLTLDADNNITLSGENQLTGELTLSGSTITINNTADTTLAGVTARNLTITSTGSITDTGTIVVQNDNMTGVATLTSRDSKIILDNENNNFDIVELGAASDAMLIESDGIILNHTMVGGALSVTSNNGLAANDVAIGDMGLGSITAATLNLNASEGGIVSQSSRLTADVITLAAASGIGVGSDNTGAINTTTSALSVINASFDGADSTSGAANVNTSMTTGVININNTGHVTINDLRNTGNANANDPDNDGDIRLENSGNIILSVTDSSGAIDANYGYSISNGRYAGDVTIDGNGRNNLSTLGMGTLSGNADIIAENLFVNNVAQFGTRTSPIGLRVNGSFRLIADPGAVQGAVYYLGNRPDSVTTPRDLLELAIRGFIGISDQQLINIEVLGEIDPAIFTEVRNYNYNDIAIRLPDGQSYGDDEDEKENEE